jgi:hypothetical protein
MWRLTQAKRCRLRERDVVSHKDHLGMDILLLKLAPLLLRVFVVYVVLNIC